MSIGPLGPINPALAAGIPLAQTKTESDAGQVVRDTHERRVAADRQAEMAAGIGEADGEDHETEERDADGRRPWEIPAGQKKLDQGDEERLPKDPQGELGRLLDLTG